ncbi:Serine/threonine-protein kinase CTR1 [Dichanthelium oligosanthes]|uniref:non-specific serine/threonine protein kinase n=1 Tax=Dichanthelium oligosanthes TaxID=888268 RepID=A0A1E5W570_9POAL|nr:Serine/threonine-protein kinase CTR1 [Dichanthelium oligosanthes]
MAAEELLRKIRELEEGQAELKREISKFVSPEPQGAQPNSSRRPLPPSPARRALAALPSSSSRLQRVGRVGLTERQHIRALHALGQAVHIIAPGGKLLYWNRYAEQMYGYSTSEAVGHDAVDLLVHPDDVDAANNIIGNIFMGKCWRGKFPVKKKTGERFFIVANNTPLYDDDGSLVGLICLSVDTRTLEDIIGPSTSMKSYSHPVKPRFQVNNRPKCNLLNKNSFDSQQPLQSSIASKITTLCTVFLIFRITPQATKVTSRVRSRIKTCQNCNEKYGASSESQYSEDDSKEEPTSSGTNTPRGDVVHGGFVKGENSPGKSSKTSSDDSGEGNERLYKISSKVEELLAKKGISWPWKGHEHNGPGKSHMNPSEFHDKQENDQIHQTGPESIVIPDYQDSESAQESKYEVTGSWWSFNKDSLSSMGSSISTNSSAIERVENEADCLDYEILWEDLVIGEQVGQGSCGTVYHAQWYGSDVAVKVFSKQEYSEEMVDTFRQEVSLMKKLRHPNIILFMGAVASPERLCIVTEFLPRGSLFCLLQKNTGKLDPRRRVHMAIDIARGMNYLHHCSPPIVHRDLKSSNLLVDKNWTVKVADFGLSRLKLETFLRTKTGKGTPQWMAPEVLRNEPSDEKSDVYSYGVILWELVTQKIPWDNLNTMQVIGAVGFMDQRLDIPSDTDRQWASMIENCWDRSDVFGFGRFRFPVSSSPEGGIAIKFGSSVHHPVLQMVLFATHFRHCYRRCLWTSEMATAFIGIIKKLSSDACRSVVRPVYEAGWVFYVKKHSAKPCKGEAYSLATTPSQTPDHGNQTPVLWVDSGATHHVACDDKLLTNLRDPPAGNAVTVTVADGFKLPVVKIGDIRTAQIQIKDVYLVPGLQMNLVAESGLSCLNHATFLRKLDKGTVIGAVSFLDQKPDIPSDTDP